MLYYNTGMPSLRLPEYGRHIQQMVDYCMTIPDRDERTACAYSIVNVMSNMFPQNRDMKKFWDHLNVISGFKLDVDFPFEVIGEEAMHPELHKIAYCTGRFRFRHYGKFIEEMISKITEMEEGDERDELISMCAHHMKKLMMQHNPTGMSNARILKDLCEYSGGKINLDPETYVLRDYVEYKEPVQQKKRKKK